MPWSSRNIKQAAACHYTALEFVLWPKADTSARAKLFLQKMQVHRYRYPRPTRTQDHIRPYTKPTETPKFRKIPVQQVSIHKEKGQTQRLGVSGISRYGRNVEDADTHSSVQCQYEYKSEHCLSLVYNSVIRDTSGSPVTQLLSIPNSLKNPGNVICPKSMLGTRERGKIKKWASALRGKKGNLSLNREQQNKGHYFFCLMARHLLFWVMMITG